MKSKVIHRSIGAFGGSSFRAIERKDRVVIQESKNNASWRDIAETSISEFYKYADRFDLFNPYDNNPAGLWKIAERINGANDLITGCE